MLASGGDARATRRNQLLRFATQEQPNAKSAAEAFTMAQSAAGGLGDWFNYTVGGVPRRALRFT